jgi:hypothetical protein
MTTGKATTAGRSKTATGAAKAAETPDDTAADAPEEAPPGCTECFPEGWPSQEVEGVGCVHGTWARQPRPEVS